jgi:superfamily II DNA or RNA helicase
LTVGRQQRRDAYDSRSGLEWMDADLPEKASDDDLDWLPPPPWRLPPAPPPALGWRQQVDQIAATMRSTTTPWPEGKQIHYVISASDAMGDRTLALDVGCRQRKKNGEWRWLTSFRLSAFDVERLPDSTDRQILATLSGSASGYGGYGYPRATYPASPFITHHVPASVLPSLLPLVVGTGRASVRAGRGSDPVLSPVAWDDGEPWQFRLSIRAGESRRYFVTGVLVRGEERLDLAAPLLVLAGGIVVFPDRVARLDDGGAFAWIAHLRRSGALRVPASQVMQFVGDLFRLPRVPRHELPATLAYETHQPTPKPQLRVHRGPREWPPDLFRADLAFDYDGLVVVADRPERAVFEPERRRLVLRSEEPERAARERALALGLRERSLLAVHGSTRTLAVSARNLPRVARVLLDEGWHVEAEGRLYRQPRAFNMSVTTGIDWFELHGTVEFDDTEAALPALLSALRRNEGMVRLGDGSYGLLPEDWLRRYAPLAGLGTPHDDHVRFGRTQVGLLDALLAAQPEITADALFARARDELRRFEGVEPVDPPATFAGTLRDYQSDGLGWLHFLRRFGFGGCLADDMGLGKTVMVLALLESRRTEGHEKPSLVVVPRSLVFNWKQEAARFAPSLSVLDYTGADRRPARERFADHDVIVTTYGMLRRDAVHLKDVEFDYVVLDEAQAIKNAETDAAKAARLLRGDHRLALSGTPVENHLGELWSLCEFLNPGMLGASGALGLDGAAGRDPDEATRALLARALRPFILRRTKAQVAPELPPRTEQTVYCELEPLQRRLYDELRDHYRRSLLGRIDRDGIARSAIVILEALLRLRQAACHPGLIDQRRTAEPAGKLDVLLPRLREVLEEGHKALVFSQFTSFLAIVRDRLDRERVRYEYLDGATRDRQARVERFQKDADALLFLVSLKAGGLGLNLTAAEHVFLLDPWWNPAVEAQAIDRAHRIGQTRHVLALRLIARDTVEERILALQARKRDLADAIINEQNSLIRSLTREDLELLLS